MGKILVTQYFCCKSYAEALEIEIDKQSLTKAKAAIKDLFDTIGRFGR